MVFTTPERCNSCSGLALHFWGAEAEGDPDGAGAAVVPVGDVVGVAFAEVGVAPAGDADEAGDVLPSCGVALAGAFGAASGRALATAPLGADDDGLGDVAGGEEDAPLPGAVVADAQVTCTAGATRPRKFSTAAAPRFLMSVALSPGIDTTSWSVPWMTTVASVTPVPLTRSSRICLAWFMLSLVGAVPLSVFAVKIT